MIYYQEILIKPSFDISVYFIWEKLFKQIHLAIASTTKDKSHFNIGVSFPGYDLRNKRNGLGNLLRLHAKSEEALVSLNITDSLRSLTDMLEIVPIASVQADKIECYAIFRRKQVRSSSERLARRYAKRHQLSYTEAVKIYNDKEDELTSLPFINFDSLSTGSRFKLFIERKKVVTAVDGYFNSYGLSQQATVPLF